MYKNILITTDGSEFAERGLIHGFDTAKVMGSKVTVITVTAPIQFPAFPVVLRIALNSSNDMKKNGMITPIRRSRVLASSG